MPIAIEIQQLIHVAIDADSGSINQQLLIKLFEFIVKKTNINTLSVSFNENDLTEAQCCKYLEKCNLKCKKETTPEKNEAEHTEMGTSCDQDYNSTMGSEYEIVEEYPESIYKLPSEANSSEPELTEETSEKKSVPSSLNLDQYLEEEHEYNIQTNDVHVIADIIEQLYGKIKKIKNVIKVLQKSIKTCHGEDSDGSQDSGFDVFKQIAFSDMGTPFEVQKYGYDSSKLDDNLIEMHMSAQGELFKEIFGRVQKRKNLHLRLSIGDFREFDLDYRTNFQTIHAFLESHRDALKEIRSDIKKIKMTILNREEFLLFKKAISSSHNEMDNKIKEYILKDPESMGIVRYFNDTSCMSCGKPARMKIINEAPICAKKETPKKNDWMKSYEMKIAKINQARATALKESLQDAKAGLKCDVPGADEDTPKKINWERKLKRLQIIHKGNPSVLKAGKALEKMFIPRKKIWQR